MNEIIIIGGYGSVGRIITQELVDLSISSIQVTVAGRDRENARTFASNFDDTVSGIKFDLQETSSYDLILQDMDMAIMCVDQTDTAFVEACLERGVDYIDVTATDQFFRAVEELDDVAVENEAAAILNVGLMPGVSNLLAVDAVDSLTSVESIDLFALLGLKNEVGPQGLVWLLEWMSGSFVVQENGTPRRVRSLTEPETVVFPKFGRQRTYRFNFADQHSLARTLNVPTVSTRACLQPRYVTDAIAILRRFNIYEPLMRRVGQDRFAALINNIPIGSDDFVIMAEVIGTHDGDRQRVQRWIRGQNQNQATGIATVAIINQLLSTGEQPEISILRCPAGVQYVHEVVEPSAIFNGLSNQGYYIGRGTERVTQF